MPFAQKDDDEEWVVSNSPRRARAGSYNAADRGASHGTNAGRGRGRTGRGDPPRSNSYHVGGNNNHHHNPHNNHQNNQHNHHQQPQKQLQQQSKQQRQQRQSSPPSTPNGGHGHTHHLHPHQNHQHPPLPHQSNRPGVRRHHSHASGTENMQSPPGKRSGGGGLPELTPPRIYRKKMDGYSASAPTTPARSPVRTPNRSGNNSSNKKKNKGFVPAELELLNTTGEGFTYQERRVIRVSAEALLARRMLFLDPPVADWWAPHDRCRWSADDRKGLIAEELKRYIDYRPLAVDDGTRWKPKILRQSSAHEEELDAEMLSKAVAILNKLSWTTLEKLTAKFLDILGAIPPPSPVSEENKDDSNSVVLNKNVVHRSMALVVEKAMSEPHFAELYASFSTRLSDVHKTFRAELLALCQEKFEENRKEEEEQQTQNEAQEAVDKKKLLIQKKKSIGLVRFIGELYKHDLIKGRIMVGCLQRLLRPDDEEKLECFAQLMTTIGARLHNSVEEQAGTSPDAAVAAKELHKLWRLTYSMAGRPFENSDSKMNGPTAPSGRIKFLLQDLVDLRENGWVSQRRHRQEKAKTIEQIHREVAEEEEKAARDSARETSLARSRSFGSGERKAPAPTRSGLLRAKGFSPVKSPPPIDLRRSKSDSLSGIQQSFDRTPLVSPTPSHPQRPGVAESLNDGSLIPNTSLTSLQSLPRQSLVASKIVEYLEPAECGEKMKALLKELFFCDDEEDILVSVEELVGMGVEGHVQRGAAVVEAGVLLVMEMKHDEVIKFQSLIAQCLEEKKLDRESIKRGLDQPLEFLRDIEIDAPRAGDYLAELIAGWISQDEKDLLSLESLLLGVPTLPEKSADFAVQILARRACVATDSEVELVKRLLERDNEPVKSTPDILTWISERRH